MADNVGLLGTEDGVLVDVVEGNTVACSNELLGEGTLTNRECTD